MVVPASSASQILLEFNLISLFRSIVSLALDKLLNLILSSDKDLIMRSLLLSLFDEFKLISMLEGDLIKEIL